MKLQRIRLHPVKSLPGVDVKTAGFTDPGILSGDRRWCLVRRESTEVSPDTVYMTKVDKNESASAIARTKVHYSNALSSFSLELNSVRSPEFRLPADNQLMSDWCSQQYGLPLKLIESAEHGWTDSAVYGSTEDFLATSGPTVISTASIAYLSQQLSLTPEELFCRFRTNLLVHVKDLEPFGEDEFQQLILGDVHLDVVRRVRRCPVPARDTLSGEYDDSFTRAFIEAKAATPAGKKLARSDLYTAGVFTRVRNCDAKLSVEPVSGGTT